MQYSPKAFASVPSWRFYALCGNLNLGLGKPFVYMVDYIDGFSYVEPSLHPWDEAYLITVDDFSDMFLDSVPQYFIEYFSIDVHEGYRPQKCGFDSFMVTGSALICYKTKAKAYVWQEKIGYYGLVFGLLFISRILISGLLKVQMQLIVGKDYNLMSRVAGSPGIKVSALCFEEDAVSALPMLSSTQVIERPQLVYLKRGMSTPKTMSKGCGLYYKITGVVGPELSAASSLDAIERSDMGEV
ncbi:hypothetical protein H671_6g16538 [Cricetulus griseus]|nr:hypothetical protein H671_6g16538 [Cricetulus griseus]